ncbi:MAG: hypothetical protein KA736_01475 [Crocinitomicaceae bacterium]|nr:hypothetical protein [Crocinitomicaceae bacterium]MBP6032680.1 hypothetical protein [Crocinitomicaceae bacterium]
MKKLLISSGLVFLISIVFRIFHLPFSSLFALLAIFLVLIFAVIHSIKKEKVWGINLFATWLIFLWSYYLFARYLFWSTGPGILGFNPLFLLSFIGTIIYAVQSYAKKGVSKIVIGLSIFGLSICFVPAHVISYFFNLNEWVNKENNKINFKSWDEYSWFLYIYGDKERALDANHKAMEAWNYRNKVNPSSSSYFQKMPAIIMEHENGIINGTWTDSYLIYDEL